ncbi:c7c4c037-ce73-48db-bf2b-eb242a353e4c [Thermothielavioides terrestris]|nr:c7c4c037-ce73-48db-bf2b-eb242a353e4c [Thermothielavioides terrestris]
MADNSVYDKCTLLTALTDALDDLILEQKIEPQLANIVVSKMRKVMVHKFGALVRNSGTVEITGQLLSYNHYDHIWIFRLRDAKLVLATAPEGRAMIPRPTIDAGKLNIACGPS